MAYGAGLESQLGAIPQGFKSLILRQNVGNSPEVTSDENSCAEIYDSRTIPVVPINKGYLSKITAEQEVTRSLSGCGCRYGLPITLLRSCI